LTSTSVAGMTERTIILHLTDVEVESDYEAVGNAMWTILDLARFDGWVEPDGHADVDNLNRGGRKLSTSGSKGEPKRRRQTDAVTGFQALLRPCDVRVLSRGMRTRVSAGLSGERDD
jgi:hypothetical protein